MMNVDSIHVGYQEFCKRVHDFRKQEMASTLKQLQTMLTKGDQFVQWSDEDSTRSVVHIHFDKNEIHFGSIRESFDQLKIFKSDDIPFSYYESVFALVREALAHHTNRKYENFDKAIQLVESL